MPTANVNLLAVLVAAVLTIALGAVWYSPVLFAKQWMHAHGYTPEKVEEMKRRGVVRAYAVSFLCYLVMAYVVGLLVSYTQATGVVQGVWLGFLAWLGFVATSSMGGVLFEGRSTTWFAIAAGYWLVSLVVMGAIIGYWS